MQKIVKIIMIFSANFPLPDEDFDKHQEKMKTLGK